MRLQFLGVLAAWAVLTSPASATEFQLNCNHYSGPERSELRARAELALRAAPKPPESVAVACGTPEGVWILWNGPPLAMLNVSQERASVDQVLGRLEAELYGTKVPPASGKPLAWKPLPARQVVRVGGVGLALENEVVVDPLGVALGPELIVGVEVEPLILRLSEGFAFYSDPPESAVPMFWTIGGGVAWGAPFDPAQWFGAFGEAGVSWVALGETDGARTSFTADLGVVFSVYLDSVALFLGAGGRYRAAPPSFGETVNFHLPHFSALVSVGSLLLVTEPERF